ncbi:alpha-amylase [Hymenobacter lapidarius]|uniref:Alpha-amylase n=1 Tax=Hymenobacter lapidarius TaxID=1908237 RepID=A0A1G1T8Y4_9BACT|nr:alpha-amylase [Hymenobacter lapidarius]
MRKHLLIAAGALVLASYLLPATTAVAQTATDPNTTTEVPKDNKLVIYQLMPRLFGNKVALNKPYGSISENGCGKFNDITDKALDEIKKMGVSHVWYTGVIEHATMTDYSSQGIPADDADVVKGRAGSPYAIRDYYDVAPDLAVVVKNRMPEYEALIKRTHDKDLKVLMDFIPNHVARSYRSDAKPLGVVDLGTLDDKTKAFAPNNNFYYLPGKSFAVPAGYNPLGPLKGPREDGKFFEVPAKATGNDVFSAAPSIDDWFETVKLNYGVDYQNGRKTAFAPVPDTWKKMRDILVYWAGKNVDGFRCDMAEMVPLEFWAYVIPEVKKVNPDIIFIAEAYNPKEYSAYLTTGKFDFLYDKVGLYDNLRKLMQQQGTTEDITKVWKEESNGFSSKMLRFLENHDEQRIASKDFATDPRRAIPAMTVTATLASGPVMLYSGQEVGEPANGAEGFSGEDGRTTIFDYWGVPEHQKWLNQGKFDGARLSPEQKDLRDFYARLLNVAGSSEAIRKGRFYELQDANNLGKEYNQRHLYAFLRHTAAQQVLVVVNFSADKTYRPVITIPAAAMRAMGLSASKVYTYTDLLNGGEPRNALNLNLAPNSAYIFEIKSR